MTVGITDDVVEEASVRFEMVGRTSAMARGEVKGLAYCTPPYRLPKWRKDEMTKRRNE